MHGPPTHNCSEKGLKRKKENISLELYSEDLDNILFSQYLKTKEKSPENLAWGYNAGLHRYHEIQKMGFRMSVENSNSLLIATICLV